MLAYISKKTSGFSLIEVLIVVSIMGILGVVTVPNYIQFGEDKKLDQAASRVTDSFNLVATRARTGENATPATCADYAGYEVTINPASSALVERICCDADCSGAQSVTTNQYVLPVNTISIAQPSTPTAVRFATLTGLPTSQPMILLKNNVVNRCLQLTVNKQGAVSREAISDCP